ncbi:hypothetical protein H310_03458 [Aphanomyces invadans]|uniref:Apple domain-containing protein n=1 Tax=Aphanomyces invadans TaxID=157072 RepID=A0A024UHK3_9STRA|nr:hypothetical protein H310_03458 [Aphanomyces invadans]ETW05774.1 hypothetical protein H310_03458 [Aphanomyces invadans]|eukprot:XP_008865551.1 hypothetical protein H310_03458 [Aphanomyces invadans]
MVSLTQTLALLGFAVAHAQIPSFFEHETQVESACNTDESKNLVCYQDMEKAKVAKSAAVARLRIGSNWCTGWLFGSEGHLITNNHCINNEDAASRTTVELAAIAPGCADSVSQGSHPGVIASTSVTLILNDVKLDFALVKLNLVNGFDLKPFGYLQASQTPVQVNDTAYIMGHPYGKPRRIAMGGKVVSFGSRAAFAAAGSTPTCLPVEANTDFSGEDIADVAGAPDLCCGACKANDKCNAYSWFDGVCYLKGMRRGPFHKANVHSARVYKCQPLEINMDFVGNDISNVSAEAAEDCCAVCRNTAGCKAFSYAYGVCYLKSSKGATKSDGSVTSAAV